MGKNKWKTAKENKEVSASSSQYRLAMVSKGRAVRFWLISRPLEVKTWPRKDTSRTTRGTLTLRGIRITGHCFVVFCCCLFLLFCFVY